MEEGRLEMDATGNGQVKVAVESIVVEDIENSAGESNTAGRQAATLVVRENLVLVEIFVVPPAAADIP